MSPFDPVQVELFRNLFSGVAEEMGAALQRSGSSPNIKERRDFSCALFDAEGRMVAQGENIPVHLGSMPASVAAALADAPPAAGEMVLLNDPFHGGTHLPDLTLVAPVVAAGGEEPVFFVANRAHHADIGGMSPGSMPLGGEIYQEGLIIPPVRLVREGLVDRDIARLILANVRTPREQEGDLDAQIAACRLGARRVAELAERYGVELLRSRAADLIAYAERMMRASIEALPDGEYSHQDHLDDDGAGSGPVPLRVRVRIAGDAAVVDFSGSAEQVPGCVNAVASITRSAVYYVFRCLAPDRIPSNHGCFAPIRVEVPAGSVLDARLPAAVAGGNVETSQRVVDLLLGALGPAAPQLVPAASQGTMNNVAFGGVDPRDGRRYAYYETIGGGCGGSPVGPGRGGVHSHMTNSLNTPVEALEHDVPVRVRRYGLRRGSGGAGRHRGGDGIVREMEFLADAEVTILSGRRTTPPPGAGGGAPGKPGRNILRRAGDDEELPPMCRVEVRAGERIELRTPGGGGWGAEPE